MKVVCPACNARYRLPDDRVRGKVLKIRCKSCGHIFQVRDPNTKATDSASIRGRSTRATGAFGAVDDSRKTDSTSPQSVETSPGSFSSERIWYYSINGESYGPYRESELFARFQNGRIGSESYVWTEGFEKWQLATEEATFNDAIEQSLAKAVKAAEPEAKQKEDQEPATATKKRAPRDRRASKTMSLDAVQLNEQLQDEQSEDEVIEQNTSKTQVDSKTTTSDETSDSNTGHLRAAFTSDSFGDEVEDALDQMFSGGSLPKTDPKPTPTDDSAAVSETPKASKTALDSSKSKTSQKKTPKVAATTSKTAAEKSSKTVAEKPSKTETADIDESAPDKDEKDAGDSLASLKSFLAASRKERRRRTASHSAIEVPDESGESTSDENIDEPEPKSDATKSSVVATKAAQEATARSATADAAEVTEQKNDAQDIGAKPSEPEKVEKVGAVATDPTTHDDDESIDISDLLGADLTGTGFGTETAAHAAIDHSKTESTSSSRKSNVPLVLIILILLLGIVFVVAELTSDDEPTVPTLDEQNRDESTIGPANPPNRALSQAEIRDRRLCMSSAQSSVLMAASEAAKAAFNAVPDEVRNPEAARQAQQVQVAGNRTTRTQRDSRQEQVVNSPPPRLDDPRVAFAQPTMGRRDDSGGGPSRQAFANGLNTFVQQSVFQCQQVHMRREGELAIARVAVSIRVNPDGSVSRVSVPPQIAATAFASCLQSQARNWRFNGFAGDSVVIERTYIIQ